MRREISYNEVHDAQRYYRLLMDSMARPGKINTFYEMDVVPPSGLNKASALIAFSLLNADVFFHYIGPNQDIINNYLLLNTSSSPVDPQYADFLFMNGTDDANKIFELKTGTLAVPGGRRHGGYWRKSIALFSTEGGIKITLQGPGVEGKLVVFVDGLNANVLMALSEINAEFPLGVDAILADSENNILCIPRSNKFSWTL